MRGKLTNYLDNILEVTPSSSLEVVIKSKNNILTLFDNLIDNHE